MNKQSICRCVIASVLSVTATSWAQTSVALGRADFKDNCASCHGHSGRGDGPVQSFLVKPPSDLTTITQRHGGKFPQELMWEVIDGRWSGDGGPHGSREMPVWGQEFKARAMTQRLGNGAMTQALDRAIGELGSSKTISLGTAKTLKIGAKTQTLSSDAALPSDEDIRRMTGA